MTTSLDISKRVDLRGNAIQATDLDLTGNITIAGTSTIAGISTTTLDAGTASVAPLKFTSGTNLTTPAAGAMEFDGRVFYDTAVASSRQVIVSEQRITLKATHDLGDATITAATPFFVDTGAATGAITLAATTGYEFEGLLLFTNTGTTSHTWSTLFGGTAGITSIAYMVEGATTVSGAATATLTSTIGAATARVVTAASTSATESVALKITGTINTSTAGTLIPQILASAQPGLSGSAGVTAGIGSYFRIWPTGTAANIVTGNWS